MSDIALGSDRARVLAVLDRAALGAVLLTPLFLLHARGLSEVAIAVADLCFILRSALAGDWSWVRTRWLLIGWTWWAWLIICSLPIPDSGLGAGGTKSLAQAIVLIRFPIWLAAMEHSVLRPPEARRWLYWVLAAAAAYIALHALFQFATGVNFYGEPAGGDGELTGPFGKPRAGPVFARIVLPAVVPPAAGLLRRHEVRSTVLGWFVLIAGAAVALLIGQRMPFLLVLLGLAVVGLFLPRLRWSVAAAGLVVAVLLVLSPVVAPKAHYRLVEKFSNQMAHFAVSQYGELYARAAEIAVRNPLTGLGQDAFGTGCANPNYFRPSFDGTIADGGGAAICWHHPHNYYLEAVVNGGLPGLALFSALAVTWLAILGRGLWRDPEPLRAALLAAAVIQFWPIASTTGFTAMPVAGWSFLLLGWGLAEARKPV
jgi:O-Antigen ligase